jgi:hypothetical protein
VLHTVPKLCVWLMRASHAIPRPCSCARTGALVAPQRSSDSSDKEGDDDANSWFRRARYFRVKITEIATGLVSG